MRSVFLALKQERTPSSATASCLCKRTAHSLATAPSTIKVWDDVVLVWSCDCLSGKMCVHTILALLHMKLSGHPQFATAHNRRVPASTAQSADGKDSKDGDEAKALPISDLHRKQARYELEHCRLMENSADVRKILNRRCVPGDCPLRSSCSSIGKTTDKHGLSRGSRACEHSFPSELHVGLQRCPDRACGASRLQLFCLTPCQVHR
jgi:hypothetical protein